MKGLLFKSIITFFLVAFISFCCSYFYTSFKQSDAISKELDSIKQQGNDALTVVLEDRTNQLIAFAEDTFLIEGLSTKRQAVIFNHFTQIWPKIKINRSLSSLYIQTNKSLLLGKALPAFIKEQALLSQQRMLPQKKIFCSDSCQMAISIPIFIDGLTGSLTVTSDLLPAIIYASRSLHIDIGVINNSEYFQANEISNKYPFEFLTNIENNKKVIKELADSNKELAIVEKGYLLHNDITNDTYFLWGNTEKSDFDQAGVIFLEKVSLLMKKYEVQQRNLLIQSASISFGIIIVIAILVFFPLKKLHLLTEVITQIGDKKYSEAKTMLDEVKNTNSKDELNTLSVAMYDALHRIEDYEKKITSTQKAFKQQAIEDSLTKLFNRNAFIQNLTYLEDAIEANEVVIALIDLDGFKPVNDNLGHEAGDEVLAEVGKRLKQFSSRGITPYRLGGDEFVVCIENATNVSDYCNQLLLLFSSDFIISSAKLKITASIGVAIGNLNTLSHSELLQQADIAMYEAKNLGKNRFCIFESAMMEYSNLRFTITNDFMASLKSGEIYLNFQPIVDIKNDKIVKLEALSRWNHSHVGFIRPDIFISIIEGTAYIKDLSSWLVEQCILKLVELRNIGFTQLIISMNISAAQISDDSSIQLIKGECDKYKIPYHLIELEITETSLISNFEAAKKWVSDAQKTGFKVSIDDFGTGYSSLSYLTLFTFDTVKIDRSLINNIPGDINQQKIAKSIIIMLKELEVDVVVEGIEHEKQLNAIKRLGADMIQGYYFSKPLESKQLQSFLSKF